MNRQEYHHVSACRIEVRARMMKKNAEEKIRRRRKKEIFIFDKKKESQDAVLSGWVP